MCRGETIDSPTTISELDTFAESLKNYTAVNCYLFARKMAALMVMGQCTGLEWNLISNYENLSDAGKILFESDFEQLRLALTAKHPASMVANAVPCREDCNEAIALHFKQISKDPHRADAKNSCANLPTRQMAGKLCYTAPYSESVLPRMIDFYPKH